MSLPLHSPPFFVHGMPTPSSLPHFGKHASFGTGSLSTTSHGLHAPSLSHSSPGMQSLSPSQPPPAPASGLPPVRGHAAFTASATSAPATQERETAARITSRR